MLKFVTGLPAYTRMRLVRFAHAVKRARCVERAKACWQMSGVSSLADSGEEPHREELVNMATGGEKRKGICCRRHPKACGGTLLVVAVVSLAVVGVAIGIRSYLEQTFLDTVKEVGLFTS